MTRTATTKSESGMTLLAVMAMMTLFATAMLAVAPTVYLQVQREKEMEAIQRGEDIAQAIQQYIAYYQGRRLPNSVDDLLEGLPQGTKKRQILRPSSAVDPLSEDGRWRLIKNDPQVIGKFAKRVQNYNNGVLPDNPAPPGYYTRFVAGFVNNVLNTGSEDDDADESFEVVTDNTPFIGVSSQSKSKSVISYYGIEKHSNWIFTPLFRGSGRNSFTRVPAPPRAPAPPLPQPR